MADKLDNSAPFDDEQGTRIAREPTGAGAEGTQGIHGDPKHPGTQGQSTNEDSEPDSKGSADSSRRGSEPLDSNSHEHVSGYGGKGGHPKQSNDGSRGSR